MPKLMRHRHHLLIHCMASFLAFLTGGCLTPTENVIYEGTYKGLQYTVTAHETHTVNGSRTDWRVRLGELPELLINITRRYGTPIQSVGAVTTDWGPPYDDALYGRHEHIYFGEKPVYSSKGDTYDGTPEQHDYTMLYLSAGIGHGVFQQYAAFMSSEWTKVDKALALSTPNFPHIIGLVGAPQQRFIRSFTGQVRGKPMVLRIDPDGYVNFGPDDGSAELNHMRHCLVQLPRKAIVLHELYTWTTYGATKADIQRFRDGIGKSPEAYFALED